MLRGLAHRAGVDVRGDARLERDLALPHYLLERGILPQPRTVSDALRAALVERLADGVWAVPLPRVTGACQPVGSGVLERRGVVLGRMTPLGACQLERHHAVAGVVHGQAGQVEGDPGRQRAEPTDDEPRHGAGLPLPALEAGQG